MTSFNLIAARKNRSTRLNIAFFAQAGIPVSQILKIVKKVWLNAKFTFEVREMFRHLGERSIATHAPIAKSEDFSFIVNDHITGYLTIIPRARMGSESIAHEAEGRMGY